MQARSLTIFGITGQTGLVLASVARDRGWGVRGFARPPERKAVALQTANVSWGEFSDDARVAEAVAGADAVFCLIGPRPPFTDVFCADATVAILAAMHSAGLRRIICQTGAMIGLGNRTLPFQWLSTIVSRRQPAVAADRVEQERLVTESGLDWTLVKPPRLIHDSMHRPVTEGTALRMGLLSSIGRTTLAHFLLDALDRDDLVGARVFVKA
jgi:putative NADH-flavin reductase